MQTAAIAGAVDPASVADGEQFLAGTLATNDGAGATPPPTYDKPTWGWPAGAMAPEMADLVAPPVVVGVTRVDVGLPENLAGYVSSVVFHGGSGGLVPQDWRARMRAARVRLI